MKISIAHDFTDTPGVRKIESGPFSGELLRKKFLEPAYIKVRGTDEKIQVILDGTYGYSPSFLEEAFAGLAREYPKEKIIDKFIFVSEDEPALIEEIKKYVSRANADQKAKG